MKLVILDPNHSMIKLPRILAYRNGKSRLKDTLKYMS